MLSSCRKAEIIPAGLWRKQEHKHVRYADTVQPLPLRALFALYLHSKCQSELHLA